MVDNRVRATNISSSVLSGQTVKDDDPLRLDLSPFKEVEALLKCSLAPSTFEYPIQEVKRQLNELLFRFNSDLQAVPISYSSLSFPTGKEYGRIMGELPTVHVDVITRILVFQPEIGQSIIGHITKVSESHVALLVSGMFNASISSEELQEKYTFNYITQTWESEDSMELNEGESYLFAVKMFHNVRGVFNIEGSVVATH